MKKEFFKPGTYDAKAGTYQEVGPRGGTVQGGRNVTMEEGQKFPPTSKSGNQWVRK